MNDNALKFVQKRLGQCMGPLSKIWEEVDDLDKDQSNMKIDELKELVEKTILMIGQTNVACLFERRLNFLAKLMHSAKNARQTLKENEKCLDGEEKLFGTEFYTILDRKVKNRKRAREISKDKGPPTKRRPFQSGPSRSSQGNRPQSRGSFHNRGGSRSAPRRGQQQKGSKGNQKRYETIHITKLSKHAKCSSYSSGQLPIRENEAGALQSPHCHSKSKFHINRPSSHPSGGKTGVFHTKLVKNHFRPKYSESCNGLQNRFHRPTISSKGTNRNKSFCKGKRNFGGRNQRNDRKKGSGGCTTQPQTRKSVFQQSLCPPQKGRRLKAYIQPQKTEWLRKVRTFQNGGVPYGEKCTETKGFSMQDRSKGCIPVHPNSSLAQKVPQFQMGGGNPTVPKPPIRFGGGSF